MSIWQRFATLLVAFLLLLAASLPARALEFMPYPNEHVTAVEWQSYYDGARTAFADTEVLLEDSALVLYTDAAADMQFAFTLPGHAAHPAWITRQLVEEDGRFSIKQIGYFAGDEAAFARLFRAFDTLTAEMNTSIEGQ